VGNASWVIEQRTVYGLAEAFEDLALNPPIYAQVVFARLTADFPKTNNTLASVPELGLSLDGNSVYSVKGFLVVDGTLAGDMKLAFTLAGARLHLASTGLSLTATTTTGTRITNYLNVSGASGSHGTVGAGTKVTVQVEGLVYTGPSDGTLQLQFAQNADDATPSHIFADSGLRAIKVAA
jgi:hypothetical protein